MYKQEILLVAAKIVILQVIMDLQGRKAGYLPQYLKVTG